MTRGNFDIIHGDCLEALKTVPDNAVDSVVMDPPYGLGFMNKSWDKPGTLGVSGGKAMPTSAAFTRNPTCQNCGGRKRAGPATKGCSCETPSWNELDLLLRDRESFVAFMQPIAVELLRVLKPGGYVLSFGGTRTYHWLAWAIEGAGFEARDMVDWMYGQGFPKSLNIAKAFDKAAGVEPIGTKPASLGMANNPQWNALHNQVIMPPSTTDLARAWEGWGTALKPAHEPILMARKPLVGTVIQNVEAWRTGGINIDGCRVVTDESLGRLNHTTSLFVSGRKEEQSAESDGLSENATQRTVFVDNSTEKGGRFPANVILSHHINCIDVSAPEWGEMFACVPGCAVRMLDAQTGMLKSGEPGKRRKPHETNSMAGTLNTLDRVEVGYADSGGASRFFYCAKPAKREKNAGCEHIEWTNPETGKKATGNTHATVKPVSVMRYLCRLVTPPGGLVLDPFMGSGTTGVAALLEGFNFAGIERDPQKEGDVPSFLIAKARLEWVSNATEEELKKVFKEEQNK